MVKLKLTYNCLWKNVPFSLCSSNSLFWNVWYFNLSTYNNYLLYYNYCRYIWCQYCYITSLLDTEAFILLNTFTEVKWHLIFTEPLDWAKSYNTQHIFATSSSIIYITAQLSAGTNEGKYYTHKIFVNNNNLI